jgi:hypothetical protein
MTLLRENLVDSSCVLDGQKTTLYTIGQPLKAKLAVVNLDTPYFKGHAQVGLVPDLMADALLGMDVMNRKQVNVVTRAQSRAEKLRQEESQLKMEDCEVIPQNWFNEDESNIKPEDNPVRDIETVDDNEEIPDIDDETVIGLDNVSMVNAEVLSQMQREDASLKNCREKAFSHLENVETMPKAFYWENDILKRKWTSASNGKVWYQIVVPERLRRTIISLAHDQPLAGHLGVDKTKERILRSFYWPGIFRNVSEHYSTCDT